MAYRKSPRRKAPAKGQGQASRVALDIPLPLDRSPIPLPSYAASIYIGAAGASAGIEGEALILHLPPSPGHTKSHRIALRPDAIGAASLIRILLDLRSSSFGPSPTLGVPGTSGSPTQQMLELMEKAERQAQAQRQADREAASAAHRRKLTARGLAPELTLEDLI